MTDHRYETMKLVTNDVATWLDDMLANLYILDSLKKEDEICEKLINNFINKLNKLMDKINDTSVEKAAGKLDFALKTTLYKLGFKSEIQAYLKSCGIRCVDVSGLLIDEDSCPFISDVMLFENVADKYKDGVILKMSQPAFFFEYVDEDDDEVVAIVCPAICTIGKYQAE